MIKIPVSIGELVDKITILQIKNENITDKEKLSNVKIELSYLQEKLESLGLIKEVLDAAEDLYDVNLQLWEVEDKLRDFEREENFRSEFIDSARSVYRLNDLRFSIKTKINLMTDSEIVEEKSYKEY
jgi:hypothetical protein